MTPVFSSDIFNPRPEPPSIPSLDLGAEYFCIEFPALLVFNQPKNQGKRYARSNINKETENTLQLLGDIVISTYIREID